MPDPDAMLEELLVDGSPASCTKRLSACGPEAGSRPPRRGRRRAEASMSSSSGTKYAVVMRMRSSASCSRARNRVDMSLQPRLRCAADALDRPPSPGLRLLGEPVDRSRRRARGRSRSSCRGTPPAARRPPGPRTRKCVSRHSSLVAGVAVPLVGDADAAGEPDRLVDDHDLAVRPMVHLRRLQPVQRPEPADAHARVLHHRRSGRGRSGARPTRRAGRERGRPPALARTSASANRRADLAAPVDERQEVDRVLAPRRSPRASPGRSRRRCGAPRRGCPRSPGRR